MKHYQKKSFWVLGASLTIILFIAVKYSLYENQAKTNVKNCEKVDLEMNVEQVIELMGEPHNVKIYRGKINYDEIEIIKYYYSAPSGSSVGVNVFFNSQTKKVVRKECKD